MKKKKKIDTSDFRRYCARRSTQSLSGHLPPSITDVGSGQRGNGNATPATVVQKRSFEIGKFYHFCREMFK